MNLLSTAARTVADWVKLGFPEEVAKRIVSGELPMDKASRMKRAEEQGYDVDNIQYHGTRADISEFKPSRIGEFGGGVYTTDAPKEASSYSNINRVDGGGSAIYPVLTKGELFDATDRDFWSRFMREGDTDEVVVRKAREAGYDGVLKNRPFSWYDEGTKSFKTDGTEIQHRNIFDPSNIRSTNAAFDPQYKGANILGNADPRLLAGIAAGGGGVSAATALSNKLAAAQAVKEQGDIRAPNSSLLHDFTMGARDLERRLEGSPASLLFPEGLVEYLEQANRAERPNAATRSWALLDFL
jgi:hypothetical protein